MSENSSLLKYEVSIDGSFLFDLGFLYGKKRDDGGQNLEILSWNAGGFDENKDGDERLERFLDFIEVYCPDVFAIIDASSYSEKKTKIRQKFSTYNYEVEFLERGRLNSSGMIIGIQNIHKYRFRIIKEMEDFDNLEMVKVAITKDKSICSLIFLYNPPRNCGKLNLIEYNNKTIIIGDFNCRHTNYGYGHNSGFGKKLTKFFKNKNFVRVDSLKENDFTFKSYKGTKTNPDLVFCHGDLSGYVSQKTVGMIDEYGHQIMRVKLPYSILTLLSKD
ncbi:hypothetical protein PVAND_017206 [Polypedilum vanderplanki]|uniref:Endonuclease/exonuclease/phosphatase domain-containing protein n=1 Tax=Polypedilum vanderplanki TaxID=319348 RepID=A0A9J6BIS0_POLVA|nr:hypothetical protein PVAND_017206 [Polypedilum vanderplanki]